MKDELEQKILMLSCLAIMYNSRHGIFSEDIEYEKYNMIYDKMDELRKEIRIIMEIINIKPKIKKKYEKRN